jgi:hypothetical protein
MDLFKILYTQLDIIMPSGKENQVDWTYWQAWGRLEMYTKFYSEYIKQKHLGVDGTRMLKLISKEEIVTMCA